MNEIVVRVDEVTLHRANEPLPPYQEEPFEPKPANGVAEPRPGSQIGEAIPVRSDFSGVVTFPTHEGEPTYVYIAAWRDGRSLLRTRSLYLRDGDYASITVPVTATFA